MTSASSQPCVFLINAMMSRKTVAFVLSADQSGSTWVGYVLGSNNQSAFLGEYYRAWHKYLSVPCTICAARGRPECELLHGIERVPVQQAFTWAFERTGKHLLIDNSKVTHWTAEFTCDATIYDIRLIHLIRDPRGWFASQRRRRPEVCCSDVMHVWRDTNVKIFDFAKTVGTPYRTVFYDDIASNPIANFRKLYQFCGLKFEQESLRYWNFTHHGFAANGATSTFLTHHVGREKVSHFLTGDDEFYERHNKQLFYDDRWRRELTAEEIHGISNDPDIKDVLRTFGKEMTSSGITSAGLSWLRFR